MLDWKVFVAALALASNSAFAAPVPASSSKPSTEASSFSADSMQTSALQDKIDAIKARYESKFSQLKQRAEEATSDLPSKEEMMIGVDLGKMRRVEWIFDLPETTMRLQTWKLHIPEFTMKRQRWVFDLPEIKLESAQSKVNAATTKTEQISMEMQSVATEMKQEIAAATRGYLVDAKNDGLTKFDGAIQLLSAALAAGPEASKSGLKAQLDDIKKSRDEFVSKIDEQLAAL